MDPARIVQRLKADAGVFSALLEDVSEDHARWKPKEGKWSLLEVINHLADEERYDFRRRLDLTLQNRCTSWPPIDPQGWPVEGRYNERMLEPSLNDFLSERRTSVRWLEELLDAEARRGSEAPGRHPGSDGPDWGAAYEHPVLGTITAGGLLTSWLAHDLIHIRQMTRLHREYLVAVLSTHSPDYAGAW